MGFFERFGGRSNDGFDAQAVPPAVGEQMDESTTSLEGQKVGLIKQIAELNAMTNPDWSKINYLTDKLKVVQNQLDKQVN